VIRLDAGEHRAAATAHRADWRRSGGTPPWPGLAAAENNVAAAWVNQDLGGQLERRHPARARATREKKAGKCISVSEPSY
jgi:hypothetical protein